MRRAVGRSPVLDYPPDSLEHKLLDRFDPDGSMRSHIDGLQQLESIGLVSKQLGSIAEAARQIETTIAVMADAIRKLAPLGWAPTELGNVEAYRTAIDLLDEGKTAEAEEALAVSWSDWSWTLMPGRLSGFGSAHPPISDLFRQRSRLVRLAVNHHTAARYDASIPILLAQIEGLCIDTTGKLFFSRREDRRADVVDDRTLAGLDEALAVARSWWEQSDHGTGTHGDPWRHPVMHGRELAYDTPINSVKTLVLLLSVMEWAEPIITETATAARSEHEQQHAGSNLADDEGRRVDDREFEETRQALRRVQTAQFGRFNTLGHYLGEELQAVLEPSFSGRPASTGVQVRCSADGSAWWAWRKTITGYVLGIGGAGPTPDEWLYEGDEPPTGPPGSDAGWGSERFDTTPNW